MEVNTRAFKAYDIRGKVPEELNEELAYLIGQAYVQLFKPRQVVVGYDIRLTSPALAASLIRGLREGGCGVIDLGLSGTEQVYFATFHLGLDGGMMVTASHNPEEYNGMKLVRAGAIPISGDSGLKEIEKLLISGQCKREKSSSGALGSYRKINIMADYVQHLLSYIDPSVLKPIKMVVNAGNGCAGPVLDELESHLPFEFIKIQHQPDGTFPNGIPNPLLPENRLATAEAVRKNKAAVGLAWDGDYDRCFFFDERGNFIEGYYIVGLLATSLLSRQPGAKIIHDPRLTWNTIELVQQAGGVPVQSKTGHAFIKERLRLEDAVYGGEMSAHHYFKDFAYCDSGMIPWLLVLELMSRKNKSLSKLIGERVAAYPVSGEINRRVTDARKVMEQVEKNFSQGAIAIDRTDGLSVEFGNWRFNLRSSNTEPVLRLNVEARGNRELMQLKTEKLLAFIDGVGL
ncbi:phosphomannomutase [Desulforamulus aeronauticus]|uniref:Phosphomannomutase n=1 Tax=Desulforamulus aeronauticus DSM 10349 TaxID=1121421 RepID=A0A1M6NE24_9FIRM|nr:phosphomannomutase [Desulforamulus aeronauticus]SHJ93955.1 phosphomannomutase [Desulforamulus aeronauticus DSM 10349]